MTSETTDAVEEARRALHEAHRDGVPISLEVTRLIAAAEQRGMNGAAKGFRRATADLEAQLAALQAELANAKICEEESHKLVALADAKFESVKAERDTLLLYAGHIDGCPGLEPPNRVSDCTCGLYAALDATRPEEVTNA